MAGKKLEGNQDWIARDKGRIRTKGAMAAERASAGLGTADDDDARWSTEWLLPQPIRGKSVPRGSGLGKR
jgi:hypothetical protein